MYGSNTATLQHLTGSRSYTHTHSWWPYFRSTTPYRHWWARHTCTAVVPPQC